MCTLNASKVEISPIVQSAFLERVKYTFSAKYTLSTNVTFSANFTYCANCVKC